MSPNAIVFTSALSAKSYGGNFHLPRKNRRGKKKQVINRECEKEKREIKMKKASRRPPLYYLFNYDLCSSSLLWSLSTPLPLRKNTNRYNLVLDKEPRGPGGEPHERQSNPSERVGYIKGELEKKGVLTGLEMPR